MSFEVAPDLEAQTSRAVLENADFQDLTKTVSNGLYDLNSSVNKVRKLLNRKGQSRTSSNRTEELLAEALEEATVRFKEIGEYIKVISEYSRTPLTPTDRFTQQKLNREFSEILNEFRIVQRQVAEKKRLVIVAAKSALDQQEHYEDDENDEQTPLIGGAGTETTLTYNTTEQPEASAVSEDDVVAERESIQILDTIGQQELDFQQSMIQEREQEVHHIEQGIHEINAIFRDLGTLVGQQGTQIDSIEENVSNIANNTENASKQLITAHEYQKRRSKWSCCVLLVLFAVLTVVLLVLTVA